MILTKNAGYLHLPKTGGTWMRQVLAPITIGEVDDPNPDTSVKSRVFFSARNPWSWYVAFYNFLIHGSESAPALDMEHPLFRAFGGRPSFDLFIHTLCIPTPEYQRSLRSYVRLSHMTQDQSRPRAPLSLSIVDSWTASGKSLYQHFIDEFLSKSTDAGRMESLKEDLESMLTECGDMTDEVYHLLNTLPRVNVGIEADYCSYYSMSTSMLVHDTHQSLIDRFNYSFGD